MSTHINSFFLSTQDLLSTFANSQWFFPDSASSCWHTSGTNSSDRPPTLARFRRNQVLHRSTHEWDTYRHIWALFRPRERRHECIALQYRALALHRLSCVTVSIMHTWKVKKDSRWVRKDVLETPEPSWIVPWEQRVFVKYTYVCYNKWNLGHFQLLYLCSLSAWLSGFEMRVWIINQYILLQIDDTLSIWYTHINVIYWVIHTPMSIYINKSDKRFILAPLAFSKYGETLFTCICRYLCMYLFYFSERRWCHSILMYIYMQ